jgi:hypothetical protein
MPRKPAAENRGPEQRKKGKPRGKPFQKGVSGNPGGRPKEEREVVEALRLKGLELAEKLLELALVDGNVKAIIAAFDRAYGKAKETVDLTATVRKEINFEEMTPERAAKVGAVLEQLERLLKEE